VSVVSRISKHQRRTGGFQTSRREIKHSDNLLARHVVLLHDFLNGQSVFEVFKNRRHRHPRPAKDPRATDLSRHAFDRLAF
jgi:hypothetical protein